MAIKNLTDETTLRELPPRYRVVCKVRLGDEKEERRPGKNLDHFRFDWLDETAKMAFEHLFGTDPISQLDIVVLGTNIDSCLDSWYRLYGANNALKRKCDGCTVIRSLHANEIGNPCVCDVNIRDNGTKSEKAKAGVCQPQGYFYFTIPSLCAILGEMGS